MNITHVALRDEHGKKLLYQIGAPLQMTVAQYIERVRAIYFARHHCRTPAVLIAIEGGKKS